MIILGIDPGFATVGFGIVEYKNPHFRAVSFGSITTPAGMPFADRLQTIYRDIHALIAKHRPDGAGIEKLFFQSNQKTAIDVAQARGVLMLALKECGIEAGEYTPLQIKQAVVGFGKAEKFQVMDMTRRLLHLKELPKPDDAADALAIAMCHAHSGSGIAGAQNQIRAVR